MDVLRRLEAERAGELALQLGVGAVVGAADDVRDLEVVVVDDAREVVGRRAVGPEQRRAAEADRAVGVGLPDARAPPRGGARRARSGGTGPSFHGSPSHSRSSRIASTAPSTSRERSVSSIRSSSQSPRRRFATAERALPRCSEPVGLGAKRTLVDMQ